MDLLLWIHILKEKQVAEKHGTSLSNWENRGRSKIKRDTQAKFVWCIVNGMKKHSCRCRCHSLMILLLLLILLLLSLLLSSLWRRRQPLQEFESKTSEKSLQS